MKNESKKLLPFHSILFLEKSESIQCLDGVIHLILCATALEAFLSDIHALYSMVNKAKGSINGIESQRGGIKTQDGFVTIRDNEIELLGLFKCLIAERCGLLNKYKKLKKHLSEEYCSGKDADIENLRELIKLRNAIVHIKTDTLDCNEYGEIIEDSKLLKNLIQKKIISGSNPEHSWMEAINEESFVKWCRKTSVKNMISVLNLLPNDSLSQYIKDEFLASIRTFKWDESQ